MGTILLKCYDTLSKQYVDIEVDEELGTYLKRSYWREDMQNRRYYKRCLELNDEIKYNRKDFVEDILSILNFENILDNLHQRERLLLYYLYLEQKHPTDIANALGVSLSTFYRLHKKVLLKIQNEKLNNIYK